MTLTRSQTKAGRQDLKQVEQRGALLQMKIDRLTKESLQLCREAATASMTKTKKTHQPIAPHHLWLDRVKAEGQVTVVHEHDTGKRYFEIDAKHFSRLRGYVRNDVPHHCDACKVPLGRNLCLIRADNYVIKVL